jgi:hypothetical protein
MHRSKDQGATMKMRSQLVPPTVSLRLATHSLERTGLLFSSETNPLCSHTKEFVCLAEVALRTTWIQNQRELWASRKAAKTKVLGFRLVGMCLWNVPRCCAVFTGMLHLHAADAQQTCQPEGTKSEPSGTVCL